MRPQTFQEPLSAAGDDWLKIVHARAQSIRFGAITVTIHDSRIVQIDSTDRVRLPQGGGPITGHAGPRTTTE